MPECITCEMLAHLPGFPGCCISCHDDQDEGYDTAYGMCGDGENFAVCCKVSQWLEEINVSSLSPAPDWLIQAIMSLNNATATDI